MPRIAFISTMDSGPWGGSEELWSQAALRLAQRGMIVGVNTVRQSEMPHRIVELQGAGCLVTRRANPQTLLQRAVKQLAGDRSLKWLSEFRPDFAVVSQGENLSGHTWLSECIKREIPYATISQMAYANFWPPDDLRVEMARTHGAARANFFVSEENMELTRRQLAHPLPNAHVARNPFNVSYDASPAWPDSCERWKLACIARLEPTAKGQDLLFDMLRQEKWRKRPIEVSLYGAGCCETSLRELQKMFRLTNVHFQGSTSDIEGIWARHHALILPSRYEGLPLVVVEAMLCGRPCIVTDVGGNAEVVEDDVTGFIARAATARDLDDTLERAWQAREKWQSMGNEAARTVRERVPRDPANAFLEKLVPLISGKK